MLSRVVKTLLSVLLAASLAGGCVKEEAPSYVGKWIYQDSEPDLGPEYLGSYVIVNRQWDYLFYDAPSGLKVKGDRNDFSWEGTLITLTPDSATGSPSYTARLKYLKEEKMTVETSSVGGTLTTINFSREPGSF